MANKKFLSPFLTLSLLSFSSPNNKIYLYVYRCPQSSIGNCKVILIANKASFLPFDAQKKREQERTNLLMMWKNLTTQPPCWHFYARFKLWTHLFQSNDQTNSLFGYFHVCHQHNTFSEPTLFCFINQKFDAQLRMLVDERPLVCTIQFKWFCIHLMALKLMLILNFM